LPAQMRRLAGDNLGVHLAVSLHAPNDALRRQLMPSAGRHPVREVVEAARYYAATTGRKVSFEYLLAAGVNDQPEAAPRLARLLRDMQCMVNVIPFNRHRFCAQLEPPSAKQVAVFVAALRRAGLEAAARQSLGGDVSAACGQLSGRLSHGSSPRGG